MKLNKDDIFSLCVSIGFHTALLALLWFMVLKTDIPEEEGGVLVNFGNINTAAGSFEPKNTGEVPEVTPPPPVPPTPMPKAEEEVVTQNNEETVALAEEKRKKDQKRKEEEAKRKEEERKKREKAERKRKEEEQKKKQQAISNKVAGAFGSGTNPGSSQGDASEGAGNQGSPFGNSDQGANEGVGGYGSFSLDGRSIGAGGLPRPAYTAQEEGRIVVNITVDPKGNVIFAEIGRGTNIDNSSLRKSALDAAKRAKFNSISGTNNQAGTITYRYTLR